MSTSKHFDKIVAVVLVLGLLLTVGFINGEALGIEKIVDEDAESYEATAYFTANDLKSTWDASQVTATIALNGDSATVSGNGAYYNDGSVVITGAGYYVVSGTLTDGNIVVDAYDSSKVFVILSGADITCSDDACLRVENAEKVFLLLAEGTENRMESGETYSQTALDDNTGGAIFAHDDLTINGSGSLELVANYKHGIDANDDLKITGGTITITAPEDGLHVNDSFRFSNANLTIHAGDDGIHSDTDVYVESGSVLIDECYEGIEAPIVEIAGGDIMLYPTDDGINANGGSSGFGGGMMGGRGDMGRGGFPGEENVESAERPNFREMFENGELPEGFELPELPEDFDGEMPQPPEGFDGEKPQWPGNSDGEMPEMPQGGERAERNGGMPGQSGQDQQNGDSEENSEDKETYIRITGGNVMIINGNARDADGLDSNGSVYLSGGTVLVSLNGDGGNNAVDYGSESGGTFEITGGTLIAAGGSNMAESPDAASTQPSVSYYTNAEAGSTVTLRDGSGNVLLTWEVPSNFTYLTLSSPDMKVGETYTLTIGDSEEEVSLTDTVTTLGTASSAGGFGGGMMGGRNRGMTGEASGETGEFRGWHGGKSGNRQNTENAETTQETTQKES